MLRVIIHKNFLIFSSKSSTFCSLTIAKVWSSRSSILVSRENPVRRVEILRRHVVPAPLPRKICRWRGSCESIVEITVYQRRKAAQSGNDASRPSFHRCSMTTLFPSGETSLVIRTFCTKNFHDTFYDSNGTLEWSVECQNSLDISININSLHRYRREPISLFCHR